MVYSIVWCIFNLIIGVGMKHLWNAISVIQFIIFFVLWQVNTTVQVYILLTYLKNLAYFEFLKKMLN